MLPAHAQAGARIDASTLKIGGAAIQMGKEYSVATKAYLALGKDGYDVFPQARMIADSEIAPILPNLVRNAFKALNFTPVEAKVEGRIVQAS